MKNWTPLDIIVIMFTGAIVFILLIVLGNVVVTDTPLNDTAAKRINILIASIVSIISMYVGAQIQKNKD